MIWFISWINKADSRVVVKYLTVVRLWSRCRHNTNGQCEYEKYGFDGDIHPLD